MKPKIGKDGIPILEHPIVNEDDYLEQTRTFDAQQLSAIIKRINNNISKELEVLTRMLKNSIADDLKKALEELQSASSKK